jgi:hypothetical protein
VGDDGSCGGKVILVEVLSGLEAVEELSGHAG